MIEALAKALADASGTEQALFLVTFARELKRACRSRKRLRNQLHVIDVSISSHGEADQDIAQEVFGQIALHIEGRT